jgi:hypothetical protein
VIDQDFTEMRRADFTVRKEILWATEDATEAEVGAKEIELIRLYRSNDPAVGYNHWPKVNPRVQTSSDRSLD